MAVSSHEPDRLSTQPSVHGAMAARLSRILRRTLSVAGTYRIPLLLPLAVIVVWPRTATSGQRNPAPTLGRQTRDQPRAGLGRTLRVLFVGNSYTYENNLPFVFEALADPIRHVDVTMLASGGATLRRHIDSDHVLDLVRDGKFDVVVAQEQSVLGAVRILDGIATIADPSAYYQSVREIAAATRVSGSRVVLYSTWPRSEAPRNLAALHNASVEIAHEVGAKVAPVGLVWDRLGGDVAAELHLYAGDGSHPSLEGTYVAAVVLARAVLGRMPELRPVRRVPLMDGAAHPNGSYADISLSREGSALVDATIRSVYEAAPREQFGKLTTVAAIPEPELPPVSVRGRLSAAWLRGEWRGDFLTFGPDYTASLTLGLTGDSASIQMIHPEEGWPEDDVGVRPSVSGPDAEGVLTISYVSKGKGGRAIDVRLVRVGSQLRGVVRFASASGGTWVQSSVSLVRQKN